MDVQGPKTSQIVCLSDSGSTITAMSSMMAAKYKFNVNPVVSDTFDIRDANNQKIQIVGKTRIKLFLYKKQIFTEVLVSTALPQEEMILGWQEMRDLGIISHHFPTPCKENRRCCKPDHILKLDKGEKEEMPKEEETKETQPSSHPTPPPPLPPPPHKEIQPSSHQPPPPPLPPPSLCQQNLKKGKGNHIEKYP